MRVTFVDNVLLEQTASGFELALQPHLGLISLVAVLRGAGHDVRLYDPKVAFVRDKLGLGSALYRDLAERILADDPHVVGFTSLGCNFACTVRIAQMVRAARPDIPIVLGGPHATIVDREILDRYPQFDVIVRNEAEGTIGDVVAALAGSVALSGVNGVTYRRDGVAGRNPDGAFLADLDTLPFAAYDAYPIAELGLSALDIDAGRGCPFGCTFCSTATFFGRRYRLKSPQRLVFELDSLADRYGIRRFHLTHDLFTVDKRKVRAFCAAVAPRAYEWTCSARIDCVDDDLLNAMRDAGCAGIFYGIETGSPHLQSIVGKKLNLSLYDPVIRKSLEIGMQTTASFITGFPDEGPADQLATLGLIRHSIATYGDGLRLQLHLLAPEPGTSLHAQHAQSLAYDGHVSDFNFPALHPDDEVMIAADPAVFMCHHFYAAGPKRERNIALTAGFRGLVRLGHVLVNAMIDDYRGDFAELLVDYSGYVRDAAGDHFAHLLRFTRDRWPNEHPFVDAVAYLAARSLLRPDDASAVRLAESAQPLRLSRRVVPIAGLLDGSEVIRRLARNAPADDPPLRRAPHLLIADAKLATHHVFETDSVTLAVARALRSNTTIARLRATFGAAELDRRMWVLFLIGAVVDAGDCTARLDGRADVDIHVSVLPDRHVIERAISAPQSASSEQGVNVSGEAGESAAGVAL